MSEQDAKVQGEGTRRGLSPVANRSLQVVLYLATLVAGLALVGAKEPAAFPVPAAAGWVALVVGLWAVGLFIWGDDRRTASPYMAMVFAGSAVLLHGMTAGHRNDPEVHVVVWWISYYLMPVASLAGVVMGWYYDDAIERDLAELRDEDDKE